MIRSRAMLVTALSLVLWGMGSRGRAGSNETAEIMEALPANMSACLVVEDLGEHFDRILASQSFSDLCRQPIIERWMKSPTYQSFRALLAFVPVYSGIDNNSLLHDVLGESLVLAFRPATDQTPAVGILACRAAKEETLDRVIATLCKPLKERQVETKTYRGVSFSERHEFGARHDFVLKMGQSLFITDRQEVVEQVIDASLDHRGLHRSAKFQAMTQRRASGCFAYLAIDAEPFQRLVTQSVERTSASARPIAERVGRWWNSLSWACISVKVGDQVSLSLDVAIDPDRISKPDEQFLAQWASASSFWNHVPADALVAASTWVDFVSLASVLEDVSKTEPSMEGLLTACAALTVGFDADQEILPALGPEVGLLMRVDETGTAQGVLHVPLRSIEKKGPMGLSLAQSLEMFVFRPLLVFYAGDHQARFGDPVRVETAEIDQQRVHFLAGSEVLPGGIRPGFAIREDRILLLSSPEALEAFDEPVVDSWTESATGKRVRSSIGAAEHIKLFIDVDRLAVYLGEQSRRYSSPTSAISPSDQAKMADLTSVLSLVDMACLSASREGNTFRTTLTLFPTNPSSP